MPTAAITTYYSGAQPCRGAERYLYIAPEGKVYDLKNVMSAEGEGLPPLDYVTQRGPFQHGETVHDYFLRPRTVQLIVRKDFRNRMAYWEGRSRLLDLLKPNRQTGQGMTNPGTLRKILPDGSKRDLDCYLTQGPDFNPRGSGWDEWAFTESLRFVAYNPVWYNPTQKSLVLTSANSQLVFPITFPITFTGFAVSGTAAYKGTWIEYPTITITGPLNGVNIQNTSTNERIILTHNIAAGQTATLDLTYGMKTIELNDGTNLMPYVTSDSDLAAFHLGADPEVANGNNSILVSGGGDTPGVTMVAMLWKDRYIGI